MAEKNSAIRSVLRDPRIYNIAKRWMGTARSRRELVNRYVRPSSGLKLLDIGCGPASILDYLDGVSYTGFDPTPGYIDAARARYGDRGDVLRRSNRRGLHCGPRHLRRTHDQGCSEPSRRRLAKELLSWPLGFAAWREACHVRWSLRIGPVERQPDSSSHAIEARTYDPPAHARLWRIAFDE